MEPFWGLHPGLAGKTTSTLIWEPFRDRLGEPVGCRNEHFDSEGCRKSIFPAFRVEACLGSLPGDVPGPLGGHNGSQNRSPNRSATTLEEKTPREPLQEHRKAPQTPPKTPPNRAQDGPKGWEAQGKRRHRIRDPSKTSPGRLREASGRPPGGLREASGRSPEVSGRPPGGLPGPHPRALPRAIPRFIPGSHQEPPRLLPRNEETHDTDSTPAASGSGGMRGAL